MEDRQIKLEKLQDLCYRAGSLNDDERADMERFSKELYPWVVPERKIIRTRIEDGTKIFMSLGDAVVKLALAMPLTRPEYINVLLQGGTGLTDDLFGYQID